jgi:acetylornithine/N-succinyldiaminopimelate aminotransferase
MTLAKGLGGGVPIGCLLAKEAASVFEPGDHGTTFGGNPLATAAGTYVMQQLLDGGVMDNVIARSEQLTQRLESLADRNEAVEGQRGKGLLRALVLTEEIAGAVALEALERGLFVNAVRPNAIRFMPALTVTEDEIDRAVAIVEDSLAAVRS